MKIALFILLFASFGIMPTAFGLDKDSLRQKQNIINGSFVKKIYTNKQYSWVNDTIYEGKGRVSGVLVWRTGVIQDMEGWGFRELLFVPDRNSVFNDDYLKFTLCRSDDEKHSTKHHCLNDNINAKISHALGKNWLEKYALSDFMVRAEVDISNHQHFTTDWIEGGIDYVDFKNLNLTGEIRQTFHTKEEIIGLDWISKDSYINLRESPNGKILYAIQKNEVVQYEKKFDHDRGEFCILVMSSVHKGRIAFLGKDSTNPKWYKVAYIPPNAKDTSKAIYGVIHSS
ncbi:hypothetical protein, partial [Helicobacter sp. T3_23-1056]